MNTGTRINISSVVGIREAIEQIFILIHRHLDSYTADPEDREQLEDCRYYLHQLNSMLEMLELNGVSVVGHSVEELLISLYEGKIECDPQMLAVIRQAIRSIYRYLDALIDGEEDNPARLFSVYRKIMQIQGAEEIPESDLFFPGVREALPLQPIRSDLDASSREDVARQMRTQFQSGLLGWLKDVHDRQSLQKMIDAVRSIEKLPAPIEQRTFWWISSGFLDSLLHQEQAADKSTRRLCGKIEQEIRHLGKETHVIADRLLRELLYRIARSQPVSERIREVSQVYDWQHLLSSFDKQVSVDENVIDEEALAADLQAMHELLEDINDRWRKFNADDTDTLILLLTLSERLRLLASRVNCPPLEKLISVMHGALSYLRIRPQSMNEGISLDIASSLLLTANAIENFHRLSPEFPEQVEALATRIRALTTGKGGEADLPELPGPDQAGYLAQEKKLLKQVAHEILANLAQAEDILDRFFGEPEIRNDLPALPDLFRQISGILDMLGLDRASSLLNLCRDLVGKLTDPLRPAEPAEQILLADALSSLGFYIEALKNSQPDHEQILTTALSQFDQHTAGQSLSAEVSAVSTEVASLLPLMVCESGSDQIADPELLAIFLDESHDVLTDIAHHLEACYIDPSDMNALTAIRRGFHTLKGSGRMVKLQDLSEVAWRIEQLMNRWLSEQKTATGALLDLLGESHKQFSSWCASLKKNGEVEIRAVHLLDRIREMMYGTGSQTGVDKPVYDQRSGSLLEPESSLTSLASETEAETSISIGDIEVPAELFRIFINEAGTHINTLKQALGIAGENDLLSITHESMLAAHTLASTSRTLGLNFIAETGQVLEQWFIRLLTIPDRPDVQVSSHMTAAVNLLDIMVGAVRNRQLPSEETLQAANELARELSHFLAALPGQIVETDSEDSQAEIKPVPLQELDTALPALPFEMPESTPAGIDRELLAVFFEEAQELQSEIGTSLRTWRHQPGQTAPRKALLRALHTLKGSARIAHALQVSDQAHQMESLVESVHEETVSTALLDQLEIQFDTISEALEQLHLALQSGTQISREDTKDRADSDDLQSVAEPAFSVLPDSLDVTETDRPVRKTMLRVETALIDRLVNDSGESSIVRSRIEAQLYDFRQYLQDLDESIDRMRGQLREIELLAETHIPSGSSLPADDQAAFDPLELDRFTRFQELTRLMAESMDDVVTIHKSLREIQRAATTAINQQAHLNRQLQQDLVRIRTVPFRHFSERLYRLVRQMARDTGKQASLIIQGDEIEIDRSVLDKINSPLEHLLRNALVHGIETPDERLKANKSETGRITLDLHREGNEIAITLHDDGIGLDVGRIREKARQLGLTATEEELEDEHWFSLIFSHGFSTLDGVTDTAGRGVGLDIVRNELSEIGGSITVTSEKGQGVIFTLRLPITLAVTQALLVSTADNTYAVPTALVTHVLEMDTETLGTAYQERHLIWNGDRFPLVYLAHLLGVTGTAPEVKRYNRILLLQTGSDRLAVHADTLIGQCEVAVKDIGAQLSRIPGIEGATITGDGNIVLLIDPVRLMQREQAQRLLSAVSVAPIDPATSRTADRAPVVMIVDDSLTVRKVTSRLLERQGYEILIAKDGVGALQLLRETVPAIMLVDIEMPHMDGFELIWTVRNNPELRDIPIIIISSRTADKHRRVAEELGVNEFMGKPYQEEELLQHIERLIKP